MQYFFPKFAVTTSSASHNHKQRQKYLKHTITMYVEQKIDYLSPVCQSMELASESFICASDDQPLDVDMEPMLEDSYTWIL